ncbi:MAG: MBL fold metallo-hydrolase [Actinobacteria bacterium]|nr:MAG: MBL fold metallo-hydrolase [Actinomycetota bacterium]
MGASEYTKEVNRAVLQRLQFPDEGDFVNARRGFIADSPQRLISNPDGSASFDLDAYSFVREAAAPDTVNPSLWRQSQLLAITGLFEVTAGIYQVRNFDLSVMTFIRGDSGWIVVDPLVTSAPAAEGLRLLREHVADLPVVAVLSTHSHADHFAGIAGVADREDVEAGRVRYIVPVGFVEAAVAENVLAGNVMARRASYMYGNAVPPGPAGAVGAGLGPSTSDGEMAFYPPTDIVDHTGQELVVDGVRFIFQYTPDAEAPAEYCFYLPQHRALCMAEIATHTLHNLYTLRGAKMRDALAWSKHLHESLRLFADQTDVLFASHHWPTWGAAEVRDLLVAQRDLYRYLHDQTLRLANHGYGPAEIAEMLELPDSIGREFANRGYYGSVNHNIKAVYNYYLGWFDGNPANLHPLPPVAAGGKFVEYAGGAEALLAKARADFDAGEYRWVAEAVNHLVFADPGNADAKALLAATYEQLAYQAESGPWRNFYLAGATELRQGVRQVSAPTATQPGMVSSISVENFLDAMAMRLNGLQADGVNGVMHLFVDDAGYTLELSNGTLHNFAGADGTAPSTIRMTRAALDTILIGGDVAALAASGAVAFEGDPAPIQALFTNLDDFDFWFPIVTP